MKVLKNRNFTYSMSKDNAPMLRVSPNEIVQLEIPDGFGGAFKRNEDPFPKIDLNRVVPTVGPIYIEGAMPGDTVVVTVKDIKPHSHGATEIFPGFGALASDFKSEWKRICSIRNGKVQFLKGISLPTKPFIAGIGVAPRGDAPTNIHAGNHGGNLDVKDVVKGTKVFLPVQVPGAFLYFGDGKTSMGDGEISGGGIDTPVSAKVKIGLIKNGSKSKRIRIETRREVMTLASAPTLDKAARLAIRDMVRLLVGETALNAVESYALLGAIGDVRIGNMVDPERTVRVAVPKFVFRQGAGRKYAAPV